MATGAAVVDVVQVRAHAVATALVLRADVAAGAAMVRVGRDADALTATAARALRAILAACAAVMPVALEIDALATAVGCGAHAAEFHVPNAFGVLANPAEFAPYSTGAAVAPVALEIGALPAAAGLSGAVDTTRSAVVVIALRIDADAGAAGLVVGTGIAAGSAVIMVAGKLDARAVAAGCLGGADGGTRSAMGVVGQRIEAGATAAGLTSSAGSRAIATGLLVGAEVPALSAAVIEAGLARALLVLALGVVTAVSVSIAVLANYLAGRRGVSPASGQHRGDDAGNDGASWPRCGHRPCKGIESLFVHDKRSPCEC